MWQKEERKRERKKFDPLLGKSRSKWVSGRAGSKCSNVNRTLLAWVSLKAEPEVRTRVQVVYLGDDYRKKENERERGN